MTKSEEPWMNSETTGLGSLVPKASSEIGPRLGEIGSAVKLAIEESGGHATPDLVDRIKPSLTQLLKQPLATKGERDLMESMAQSLRKPVTPTWCSGRVLTLLSHYYVADADERQAEAMISDWLHELDGLPAWTIAKASRWWLSGKNESRKRKPLPGDISEISKREMGLERLMRASVAAYDRGERPQGASTANVRSERLSDEEKARRREVGEEVVGSFLRKTRMAPEGK